MTDVVRMSSAYDEATTSTEAGGGGLSPDAAMRQILDDGGETYDEFLAKLFVNCIGAYPVGSMVELDTGELGVVVNLPIDPVHYNRPQVKVVTGQDGDLLGSGNVVDLSKKSRAGQFRKVLREVYLAASMASISRNSSMAVMKKVSWQRFKPSKVPCETPRAHV